MTNEEIQTFRRRVHDEMYLSAYLMLINEIEKKGKTKELIGLSKELSKAVRSKSYYYANKKAENMANEMDALLKLIIKINGEGIYG